MHASLHTVKLSKSRRIGGFPAGPGRQRFEMRLAESLEFPTRVWGRQPTLVMNGQAHVLASNHGGSVVSMSPKAIWCRPARAQSPLLSAPALAHTQSPAPASPAGPAPAGTRSA